jgi:hypothetical protein
MMLVYRIEDVNGGGIYRGDFSGQNPMGTWSSERHPAPRNDSLLVHHINNTRGSRELTLEISDWVEHHNYIFGFASPEQLRAWVYEDLWITQMQRRGFRLTVLEVEDNDVLVGHTQCIFKREHVKQESYFNIADFFGISDNGYDEDDE